MEEEGVLSVFQAAPADAQWTYLDPPVRMRGYPEAVIEFQVRREGDSPVTYEARVVQTRPPRTSSGSTQMTHEISYLSGTTGREWVSLNESEMSLCDAWGNENIPYLVKLPAAGSASPQRAVVPFNPVSQNEFGWSDATKFHLTRFAVPKNPAGEVNNVHFSQSMGRITLTCPLEGDFAYVSASELEVEMSSTQLSVGLGPRQKLDALCGEFAGLARRYLSTWEIEENLDTDGPRRIVVSIVKVGHMAWTGPWNTKAFAPIRRQVFGWTKTMLDMASEDPEKELVRLNPGKYAVEVGTVEMPFIIPSATELCTGADCEETTTHTLVRLHLDEQTLNVAKAQIPIEELFGAEVSKTHLSVHLKATSGEEMAEEVKEHVTTKIMWGDLSVEHIPEQTSWILKDSFRREPPEKAGIIRPAYYNPVLEIKLAKKTPAFSNGSAFVKMESQRFSMPREVPHTGRSTYQTQAMLRFDPKKHAAELRKLRGEEEPTELELATGGPGQQKGNRGPRKVVTRLTAKQDESKAVLSFYINDKLADDPESFAMRVRETSLQLICHAGEGIDYVMFGGSLGGRCKPDDCTWKCARKENGGPLVMEVEVKKAWARQWESVFEPRWDN